MMTSKRVRPPLFRRGSCFTAFTGLLFLAILSSADAGQKGFEDFKLIASDGQSGDAFGQRVAVDGNVAVIGAPHDDDFGDKSGAAYVFRKDTGSGVWVEEAKLTELTPGVEHLFGISVGVSGDRIIIGASKSNGTGSAEIFRYSSGSATWTREAVLQPSDLVLDDLFGQGLGISGDTAVVGSNQDDDMGADSGSAYVFRYDPGSGAWLEEAKLTASDGDPDDRFGKRARIDGDVILTASRFDDENGLDSGSAYVFRYDPGTKTWSEEAKLLPWDGAADEKFGFSAALDGDLILIGAPGAFNSFHLDTPGAAYLYRYDTRNGVWIGEDKLGRSYSDAGDEFGNSVALSGDVAVVGARFRNGEGAAYAFRYLEQASGWGMHSATFTASDGKAGDQFGRGVAVTGDGMAFVGSRHATGGTSADAGAVYAFTLPAQKPFSTWIVPDQFATIQDGLSGAGDGDVIVVRPGTYRERISFPVDKTVVLRSEHGPAVTVIDGEKKSSVVAFLDGYGSVLDGFTVTNGSGYAGTIHGTVGGGVYCAISAPTIRNCVICANEVDYSTGGAWGGGLFAAQSEPRLIGNVFRDNRAESNGSALYTYNAAPIVTNNTFHGNRTPGGGGTGGALFHDSRAVVSNSIFWGNDGRESSLYGTASGRYRHSDIQDGYGGLHIDPGATADWGAGMIDLDPLFFGTGDEDFHLRWDSPCRNNGDNGAVARDGTDFEGDPRVHDGFADMGADEFHAHLYLVGVPVPSSPVEVRIVGAPGRPVTLALGRSVVSPPIATAHGDLHIWPILNSWGLGAIPATGVTVLPAAVPSAWIPGRVYPFQAQVGNWGHPDTLLTNLLPLIVE